MASIHQDVASKMYRVMFRFGKPPRQFQRSLGTTDYDEAEGIKGLVENTLRAIEHGWLSVPANVDFVKFVISGGKLTATPSVQKVLTLGQLLDRYLEERPKGSIEGNSLGTCRTHAKHLVRLLGGNAAAQTLAASQLQGYVNQRAKESYNGRLTDPETIKKEISTLGTAWRWAALHKLLVGAVPTEGLMYEKGEEKLPFKTWEEIERTISRGGLSEAQIDELWECLFLNTGQVQQLLEHVKEHAAFPYVYPMFVFVAHTGARRSEMIRSQVEDIDFHSNKVCIREKKRDRKVKLTFRHVHMSPLLRDVMAGWIEQNHPGGPHTFCRSGVVPRSRTRSRTTGHKGEKARATNLKGRQSEVRERVGMPEIEPLSRKVASDSFDKPLERSKWQVVPGFHVFRHSLASNMAVAGIRQEVIDATLGHQTEDMRRRYRHLFPQESQDAMQRVFG